MVVVEHGKGDMSLYGYNQSALVSVGTRCARVNPLPLWAAVAVRAARHSISKFVVRVRRSIHSRGWEDKFCFNFVELLFP